MLWGFLRPAPSTFWARPHFLLWGSWQRSGRVPSHDAAVGPSVLAMGSCPNASSRCSSGSRRSCGLWLACSPSSCRNAQRLGLPWEAGPAPAALLPICQPRGPALLARQEHLPGKPPASTGRARPEEPPRLRARPLPFGGCGPCKGRRRDPSLQAYPPDLLPCGPGSKGPAEGGDVCTSLVPPSPCRPWPCCEPAPWQWPEPS